MDEKFKEKYDHWNLKKQDLQFDNNCTDKILFNEGEIWWCSLGLNIGTESFGKGKNFYRPVLIIKKLSNDFCVALLVTSKRKVGSWFYNINFHNRDQCIVLYQIKALHIKRLYKRMGQITDKVMLLIKEKLEDLLELSSNNHSA